MAELDPAVAAALATAVCAALLQFMTMRLDTHRTEAHELRDQVGDLKRELDAVERERDEWREKYFALRGGGHGAE